MYYEQVQNGRIAKLVGLGLGVGSITKVGSDPGTKICIFYADAFFSHAVFFSGWLYALFPSIQSMFQSMSFLFLSFSESGFSINLFASIDCENFFSLSSLGSSIHRQGVFGLCFPFLPKKKHFFPPRSFPIFLKTWASLSSHSANLENPTSPKNHRGGNFFF